MITDRISLNLAYIYLSQLQNTTGTITDIELVKIPFDKNYTKGTTRFSMLSDMHTYIQNNAQLIKFSDLECKPLSLYELKALNIVIDNSAKNFVYSENRVFKTKSININQGALDILNKSYIPKFIEVLNQFNDLRVNEYIKLQNLYIDCGYIHRFFEEDYKKLQELYKKNKTI
jgi:hypothetical protein